MTIFDKNNNSLPSYYSVMYLDGYTPYEILTAARSTFLEEAVPEEKPEVKVISEIKVRK